jgi:hypothetical protein
LRHRRPNSPAAIAKTTERTQQVQVIATVMETTNGGAHDWSGGSAQTVYAKITKTNPILARVHGDGIDGRRDHDAVRRFSPSPRCEKRENEPNFRSCRLSLPKATQGPTRCPQAPPKPSMKTTKRTQLQVLAAVTEMSSITMNGAKSMMTGNRDIVASSAGLSGIRPTVRQLGPDIDRIGLKMPHIRARTLYPQGFWGFPLLADCCRIDNC